PRAWFVPRLAVRPAAEVLRTIKEGQGSDGTRFDPAETALLEAEDVGGSMTALPPTGEITAAQVRVTRYAAQRIELQTITRQAAFLVLSEVYYRGWDAWVDGRQTPVYRTDYALRGIAVPPGEHRVEFVFRAPSFRTGAIYAGLGVALLLVGGVVSRRR